MRAPVRPDDSFAGGAGWSTLRAIENRNVKGVLFVDYVRVLRSYRDIDWSAHLLPEDLRFLAQRIAPAAWYPMATFERFGLAILREVVQHDLGLVREFGRASIDGLCQMHDNLVAPGDPMETLLRFRVLRQGFFDFQALEIEDVYDGEANAIVSYGMSAPAEEAATFQTMGFFERLLEVSGAASVQVRLASRSWRGDPRTTVGMTWQTA